MADISDYLLWRGDISFAVSPFNEIDALILCQILYLDFDGIVSADFKSGIALKDAAQKYAVRHLNSAQEDLGVFINSRSVQLLTDAGNSIRFGEIELRGFVNEIDVKIEKQFAAVTATIFPKKHCIVYRGTDDTLVGWKEDFNMTAYDPVPCQQASLAYLEKAQAYCRGKLYTAGHSKGGNLAVYAPAFCSAKTFKKIENIFCFDGPGFNSDTCERGDIGKAFAKAACFVPRSSVVGVLLHHAPKLTVVHSCETNGIRQHDLFSWQLHGSAFALSEKRSDESLFTENTVKAWLKEVPKDSRAEFIDRLFEIAGAGGALTLAELKARWLQTSAAAIKTLHTMDGRTKEHIFNIFKLFLKAVRSNMPGIGEFFSGNSKSPQNISDTDR